MTRWPRATPGLLPGLLTTRQQEHHPGGQRPHTESGWPRGPSGQGHEGSDGLGLVATYPMGAGQAAGVKGCSCALRKGRRDCGRLEHLSAASQKFATTANWTGVFRRLLKVHS